MFTIKFKGSFQHEFKFKPYGSGDNVFWDSDIIRPKIQGNNIYIGKTMIPIKLEYYSSFAHQIGLEINSRKPIVEMEFYVHSNGEYKLVSSNHWGNKFDRFLSLINEGKNPF